jgi:hypothetical protein
MFRERPLLNFYKFSDDTNMPISEQFQVGNNNCLCDYKCLNKSYYINGIKYAKKCNLLIFIEIY